MTGAEIIAVVSFFVLLFGAFGGMWKYIDGKLMQVEKDAAEAVSLAAGQAAKVATAAQTTASQAREELSAHKLHVAETYVTKLGMQEQTAQIMRSIEAVGSKLDRTNERLDRFFEQNAHKA